MKALARPIFCALIATLLTGATGYKVNYASNQDITEWSTCKNVANASPTGQAIFIPTNTSTEWSTFYTKGALGVTISVCAPSCGGTSYGGYCWYLGANNASCTTTCTGHGGTVDGGAINYAGSGGSLANCVNVITALGQSFTASADQPVTSQGFGCYYQQTGTKVWHTLSPATTQAASISGVLRACSCAN